MPLSVVTPLVLLFLILGSGVWVSLGLLGVGIASLELFRNLPVDRILAQTVWNVLSAPELIAMPMFILMAELLFRSRFVDGIFYALEPWVRRLPGGLSHTTVLGCAFFALVSGSSVATTNTVGRITLSELPKRGYDKNIIMGSLAGAGTLGFLIPPSIIMIIYGVLTQTSVLKLFAAGIIPGILLGLAFMSYLAIRSFFGGTPKIDGPTGIALWKERFQKARVLIPIIFLMAVILGSMYGGYASPSEAASVAVGITLVIMLLEGSLSLAVIREACLSTARTSSFLGLIIGAAGFLSTTMGYLALPQTISAYVQALELTPFQLMLLLMAVYVLLGCVLEGMSLILMTLPVVLPLVLHAGYDKIWFGVFLILMVELAQITPPVGLNLFVIQGITGEKMTTIIRATAPFFLIMVFFVVFLILFPEVVTYLPGKV